MEHVWRLLMKVAGVSYGVLEEKLEARRDWIRSRGYSWNNGKRK